MPTLSEKTLQGTHQERLRYIEAEVHRALQEKRPPMLDENDEAALHQAAPLLAALEAKFAADTEDKLEPVRAIIQDLLDLADNQPGQGEPTPEHGYANGLRVAVAMLTDAIDADGMCAECPLSTDINGTDGGQIQWGTCFCLHFEEVRPVEGPCIDEVERTAETAKETDHADAE